jgi:hypothetical protein
MDELCKTYRSTGKAAVWVQLALPMMFFEGLEKQ